MLQEAVFPRNVDNIMAMNNVAPEEWIDEEEREKQEKRELRNHYRQLITATEENSAAYVQANSNDLFENIGRLNKLYAKVTNAQEATLDSRLLVLSADLGKHRARKMKLDHTAFEIDDYVTKLKNFLQREGGMEREDPDDDDDEPAAGITQADWARMGRLALASSSRVGPPEFMLGPLAIEKKERKVARRAREKDTAELRKPQEVQEDLEAQGGNDTTKNVMKLSKLLSQITRERGGPVNFFEFIINPESFGQTVENLFYLSFLVRDGQVEIKDDEETRQPMLDCCEPATEEDRRQNLIKKQLIMDLDMETYNQLIEVYNISKPIIPTRPSRAATITTWQ